MGGNALNSVGGDNLRAPAGETLGLVGESGCGKSTIARAIVGLVPLAGGVLLLDGVDHSEPAARDRRPFRRRVQMIFQDPYSSLNPRMTVGEMIGEELTVVRPVPIAIRRPESLRLLG